MSARMDWTTSVAQQLLSVWNTVRNKVEVIEDTLRTKRSLRRFLANLEIEPFFLDPPSVLNCESDLIEAIYDAMRRHALSHIHIASLSDGDPANAVWGTIEGALTELVSSRIDCGQRIFSIRNIDEMSASKSTGPFKSIREFGAHIAKYYSCSSVAEFHKATSHSFPVGKRFTIIYHTWTGRYRWENDDGSHNAAVAQWYAHTHNEDFHFTADLYQQTINQGALDALRKTTVRGFLMPIEGLLNNIIYCFTSLRFLFRRLRLKF
jgi:hypothetical protein